MTADDTPKKISLKRIAHVYYKHKDLDKAKQFALDFGFFPLEPKGDKHYFRGYGTEPFTLCLEQGDENEFMGAGFVVDSMEDLELASKTLPEATEIYDLTAPGGGKAVTFKDPYDHFPWHLVYGQESVEPIDISFPALPANYPREKNRAINKTQRFEKRPTPVHKLGHFGVCVTNFDKSHEFYTTRFNFYPSDLVKNDEGKVFTVFYRLARGKEVVDHHSFFFFEGPEYHVHHSSYETHDFDSQVLGHDWLREKGYDNCWGVGRHVMGSQIFDYWYDPGRFIMEHYVDGDLFDDTEETHVSVASPNTLYIWGPEVPDYFLK